MNGERRQVIRRAAQLTRRQCESRAADLRRLLLRRPKLRSERGSVAEAIARLGGGVPALAAWRKLVHEPPVTDEDVDEGY